LLQDVKGQWKEKEVRIDDAETPVAALTADLQAALADKNATVAPSAAPGFVAVRALGAGVLDSALVTCFTFKEKARAMARAPPHDWDGSPLPPGKSFVRVAVAQGSEEWTRIAARVAETMPAAKVTAIERVQNPKLWDEYAQKRSEVAKDSVSGFDANEVWCFHGTRAFPVDEACEKGLDFRHGNTSSMWGPALYIAVNALYSHSYASPAPDGQQKQFFYARAALGRVADLQPNKALRAPPAGSDSIQGTTGNSRVHMLYDLGQAYPEYLVTYTPQ
jgi:hypothetical protein